MQPGRGRATHLGQPDRDDLGGPGQLSGSQGRRLRSEPFGLVGGHVYQPGGERVGHRRHDDEVTEPAQQVLGEPARILADLDHLVHTGEDATGIPGGERVHELVQQRIGRVAEEGGRALVLQPVLVRPAEQLVEHRERIADRARPRPDNQRQDCGLDLDPFRFTKLRQVVPEDSRGHQAEGVVVGTRADGADDLVRLGRREDELDVRRRLLDQLQQGVETLGRDHVGLVDDVDLVATRHRGEEGPFAQVTSIVHTAVTGRVDLDHVDAARAAAGQVPAGPTGPAGLGDRALLAVQCASENPGRGRLAAAAGTREQVGVVDPVVGQRPLQRLGDVGLADDVGEDVWAVAPVERKRGRGRFVRHPEQLLGLGVGVGLVDEVVPGGRPVELDVQISHVLHLMPCPRQVPPLRPAWARGWARRMS